MVTINNHITVFTSQHRCIARCVYTMMVPKSKIELMREHRKRKRDEPERNEFLEFPRYIRFCWHPSDGEKYGVTYGKCEIVRPKSVNIIIAL